MTIVKPVKKIDAIGEKLEEKERLQPFKNKSWRDTIPKKAGVYVLWKYSGNKGPVYVGETSNLFERLLDLGSWRNHTFTRQIKAKYTLVTPVEIRKKISKIYRISYIPIACGRKEAEEYLIYKWGTYKMFNKPSPRYIRSQKHA